MNTYKIFDFKTSEKGRGKSFFLSANLDHLKSM
jgi:hypothetical protein